MNGLGDSEVLFGCDLHIRDLAVDMNDDAATLINQRGIVGGIAAGSVGKP
jgi:hypothetical protein